MVRLDDGRTLRVEAEPLREVPAKRGGFGSAKGWFMLSEDFDEPLGDFREYME